MKILLLASQHGNELLGEKLYEYIQKRQMDLLPYLTFKLANPVAHRRKVRFIETDLNRSYVSNPLSYEEKIALGILNDIKQSRYDLVLDLHTTRARQEACLIVFRPNETARRFINISSMRNVVIMDAAIAATSLIGKVANAVCLEVEDDELNNTLYEALSSDLRRFVNHKDVITTEKRYFSIYGLIDAFDQMNGELNTFYNFKKSRYGFYPVLFGEPAYEDTNYRGFKARLMPKIKGEDRL